MFFRVIVVIFVISLIFNDIALLQPCNKYYKYYNLVGFGVILGAEREKYYKILQYITPIVIY